MFYNRQSLVSKLPSHRFYKVVEGKKSYGHLPIDKIRLIYGRSYELFRIKDTINAFVVRSAKTRKKNTVKRCVGSW